MLSSEAGLQLCLLSDRLPERDPASRVQYPICIHLSTLGPNVNPRHWGVVIFLRDYARGVCAELKIRGAEQKLLLAVIPGNMWIRLMIRGVKQKPILKPPSESFF